MITAALRWSPTAAKKLWGPGTVPLQASRSFTTVDTSLRGPTAPKSNINQNEAMNTQGEPARGQTNPCNSTPLDPEGKATGKCSSTMKINQMTISNIRESTDNVDQDLTHPLEIPLSSVARGTEYELRVTQVLNLYHPFNISHAGKSWDGGIDFYGTLSPPSSKMNSKNTKASKIKGPKKSSDRVIPILGQCKTQSRPLSPMLLQAFSAVMAHSNDRNIYLSKFIKPNAPWLGVFVTSQGYTKGTLEWARVCSMPLLLMTLPPRLPLNKEPGLNFCMVNEECMRIWPWLKVQLLSSTNCACFLRHIF
jgi:hypothetical protein